MNRRRQLVPLTGLLAVLVAAGCSTSGGGAPSSSAPSSSSSGVQLTDDPPIVASSAPTSVAPSTSTAPGTSSAPASTASGSVSPSAQPKSTCTSLMIRVIRGSGVTGREFAALQFTNTGNSACMLYGYPTVTLAKSGRRIGRPSQPAGTESSALRLGPEGTAESKLNDYVMNCNAALSDTITVVAPGSTISTTRPITLRACTLRTERLGQPD